MSVGYCSIAALMSALAMADGVAHSTAVDQVQARAGESSSDRVFGVLNALGGIAFTFGGQAGGQGGCEGGRVEE